MEPIPYLFPRNCFYGAGIKLGDPLSDLDPPGPFDFRVWRGLEALEQHASDLSPIGLRESESILQEILGFQIHAGILPYRSRRVNTPSVGAERLADLSAGSGLPGVPVE